MMSRNSGQIRRLFKPLLRNSDGSLAWRRFFVLALLVAAYLLFQPWIVATLDIRLPGFSDLRKMAEVPPAATSAPRSVESSASQGTAGQEGEHRQTTVAPPPSANGAADRPTDPSATHARESKTPSQPVVVSLTLTDFLRHAGRDLFESPAGLRYTRGSDQGHRIKHVLAHARDNPGRSGQHGVFDPGDEVTVFQLIDEAYEQATAGVRTKTKQEGERTVHTVDLGRRIGYVGGQSGERRDHPPAQHVRLVLQHKNVITAFPVIP